MTSPFRGPASTTRAEALGAGPSKTAAQNTTAINAALAGGGWVTLTTPGTYQIACNTARLTLNSDNTANIGLLIPSNTRFTVGMGVTLQINTPVTNPILIANTDFTNGNSNIIIEGGTWDGSKTQGGVTRVDADSTAGSRCMAMRAFMKCTNLTLRDSIVTNGIFWFDWIGGGTVNNKIEDMTYIDTNVTRTGAVGTQIGGLIVGGANSDLYIRNIYGNTTDDLVEIVSDVTQIAADVGSWSGSGTVQNLVIDGLTSRASDGCYVHLRLLDSTANPIKNARISNVNGPYLVNAMRLGSDFLNLTSNLTNITIDGVNCSLFGAAAGPGSGSTGTIAIVGSATNLTIRNMKRVIAPTESNSFGTVHVKTVVNVPTVSELTIDGLSIQENQATTTLNHIHVQNGTVNSMAVNNVSYFGSLSAGAGVSSGIAVSSGATIGALRTSNTYWNNPAICVWPLGTVTFQEHVGMVAQGQNAVGSSPYIYVQGGTCPTMNFYGCSFTQSTAATAGCLKLNGSVGTTKIQSFATTWNNQASPAITRAASEGVRWIGNDAVNDIKGQSAFP